MPEQTPIAPRKTRILDMCRDTVERCDDVTLRRLEQMLLALAEGGSLQGYLIATDGQAQLPSMAVNLLALLDPPLGQA
ncbi:hypothetical protein [Oleisolibacter albus]|uniref:hypothetical protein n=1 Tax=Oleisolibacter albus TaxID=2171757 RepID=UPI000DF24696|nr:hypothetical protein [Oleisolibacter albus]